MEKVKNTGIRYNSWHYDPATKMLIVKFSPANLRATAEELVKFFNDNPDIDESKEMVLGLTSEAKKVDG